jgi:hypothetical protein
MEKQTIYLILVYMFINIMLNWHFIKMLLTTNIYCLSFIVRCLVLERTELKLCLTTLLSLMDRWLDLSKNSLQYGNSMCPSMNRKLKVIVYFRKVFLLSKFKYFCFGGDEYFFGLKSLCKNVWNTWNWWRVTQHLTMNDIWRHIFWN